MHSGIKLSFNKIKGELDVHLDSINQNTSEIQNIYDYLQDLDSKIEKLNERIDELNMFVGPKMTEEQLSADLTHREQEVFVVLYAQEDKITAKDIARKLGFSDEMVNRYIYNLITKGIPVLKQYEGDTVQLYLDLKFKNLQAKKNILKIEESISKQLLSDKAI